LRNWRSSNRDAKPSRSSVVWQSTTSRGCATRRYRATAMLVVMFSVFAGPGVRSAYADGTNAGTATTRVIVTAADTDSAHGKVQSLHGQVSVDLPVINGVAADVTADQQTALASQSGVTVSPDPLVFVNDVAPSAPAAARAPAAVFPQLTGASRLVAGGITGKGVNVAVLDTGIANVPDFAGRLVGGIDLSGGGDPFSDSFGHGTFVAGLIAGNGASSAGHYLGEAPGAGLVSIKVAGATGVTDVATVIAGINWAVANQASDHISILNLSLGAVPTQSTVLNPLDRAVEVAWRSGITVVASAGNSGPFNGTVVSPGDDPLVITVGALDDKGTVAAADDTVSPFSSVGPTNPDGWFKPDLVSSGRSVVSVRAPDSTIDTNYPSARIGTGNFVGSGTSFSAAIASGAAALVAETIGSANPDSIKARLLAGTTPGPTGNPFVDGHGSLNAFWASALPRLPISLNQVTPATPTAVDATVQLQNTWNGSAWNGSNWNGSAWNGGAWNGGAWNGSAWNGSAWNGSAWNGSAWNGSAWNDSAWNDSAWNGSAWNGSAWNGSAWNGGAWNGSAWNGGTWNGSAWNGGAWNGSAWNGSAWNGSAWNGSAWNGGTWNGSAWN
jgi:serine protease AprX